MSIFVCLCEMSLRKVSYGRFKLNIQLIILPLPLSAGNSTVLYHTKFSPIFDFFFNHAKHVVVDGKL